MHKHPFVPMVLREEPTKAGVFRRQHGAQHGGVALRAFIGPTDTAWMQQHQRWWVRTAEKVEAKEGTTRKLHRRKSKEPRYDGPGDPFAGAAAQHSPPEYYDSHDSEDVESDWSSLAGAGCASSVDSLVQTPVMSPEPGAAQRVPAQGSGRNAIPMPVLPPSPHQHSPHQLALQSRGAVDTPIGRAPETRHRRSMSAIKSLFRRHSTSRPTPLEDDAGLAPGDRRSLDTALGGLLISGASGQDPAPARRGRDRTTSLSHAQASLGLPGAHHGQPAVIRSPVEAGAVSPRLPSLRRIAVTRSSRSNTGQPPAETNAAGASTAEALAATPSMSHADIRLQILAAADKLGAAVSPAPSRVWRARKAMVAKVKASYRRQSQLPENAVILSTRAVIRRETVSHEALSENYNETTCRRFRESAHEWAEMWLALTKRGILFYPASKRRPAVAVLFPPYAQTAPRVSLFSTLDLSLAIMYYSRAAAASTASDMKSKRPDGGAAAAAADDPEASRARLRVAIIKFPSTQVACEWYREIGQALLLGRAMYPNCFLHECPPAAQPAPGSVVVNVPEIGVKVQVKLGRHGLAVPAGVLLGGPDDALLERQWRCEATTAWHVRRDAVNALLSDKVVGDRVREWLDAERLGQLTIGMAWRRYDRLDWIMPCGALDAAGCFKVDSVNDRVVGPQLLEGTHSLELRVLEHYPDSVAVDRRRVDEPLGAEGFVMLKRDKRHKLEMATYRPALLTTHDGFLFFIHAPRAVRHLEMCASGCNSPPASANATHGCGTPSADAHLYVSRSSGRRSLEGFSSNGSIGAACAGQPVSYYHTSGDNCSRQMSLAKYMLCITDIEHIVPVGQDPENAPDGALSTEYSDAHAGHTDGLVAADAVPEGRSPRRVRTKSRLLGLLRSKKVQQSACKFKLVSRTGAAVELWAASAQCVSEWIQRLTELRFYWTNRLMADLALNSRVCMLNYAIQGRGNRHRDMLDWSDEGACADRNIWHACLILGCRSIVKAGVLYRKRMRHQGMQKVFCILTQGRLVEFAFPPLPLPPPPEQAALAERIAGHNPVMARMFGGRDSEVPAPSNTSHPAPGGSEAHLIFSRLRTLALRQCYVVSRFSDDLSTEDMMCEPWVLTDIGNYSGLRLADRMYADGVVSHELITDCIFTVWRPASVSAALRADSDSMSRHIPADLSDAGDLSPGERMTGSGPDSKCSSPSLSVGGADCERATSPSMLSVRHQLAAGGYSAPSSPQAPAAAATAAASAASAQDRQNRHRRSTSQDIGGHISDAPHALGDGNASSVSNASSASSSRQRDTSRPGGDGRPGGQTQMYAAGMSTSTRKRVGVYRARTNAEMTQWVTAINQEIRRLSLAGEW